MSFATGDILYNQYNFDPVVFAWNMDPKTMPGRSPYEVFGNNPVLYTDHDGDDPREGGKILNIPIRSMLLLGNWYVDAPLKKSTLESFPRVINDVELYEKADEAYIYMSIPDFLKEVFAKLQVKTVSKLIEGYTKKVIKKPLKGSAVSFLQAATSDFYTLREYTEDDNGVIRQRVDRVVTNFGIKGFESEVTYKEVHDITYNMQKHAFVASLSEFTAFKKPQININYGKSGTKYENYKFIQSVVTHKKNDDGTFTMITKEVGVNPREGNTRTDNKLTSEADE